MEAALLFLGYCLSQRDLRAAHVRFRTSIEAYFSKEKFRARAILFPARQARGKEKAQGTARRAPGLGVCVRWWAKW